VLAYGAALVLPLLTVAAIVRGPADPPSAIPQSGDSCGGDCGISPRLVGTERELNLAWLRTPAQILPINIQARDAAALREWAASEDAKAYLGQDGMGPWELTMFGRVLAIDGFVESYAAHYGTDLVWQMMALWSQSSLDPLAEGPEDGDRGLGQVSFQSEKTARKWASNQKGAYYDSLFRREASIWDPETNIALSTIVLRSIYAMRDVDSSAQAYARYSDGLVAMRNHVISPVALIDVRRAESLQEQVLTFYAAKYAEPGTVAPALGETSSMTETMLALDRELADGAPMYLALRDLYVAEAAVIAPGWASALYLSDALMFTALGSRVYGVDGAEARARIREIMLQQAPAILGTGDGKLIDLCYDVIVRSRG
jgi:hypothetical protein